VRLWFLTFAALCLIFGGAARAQSCNGSITDLRFGNVNAVASTPTDVNATLTINCASIPTNYYVKICMSIGAGNGGSSGSQRLMNNTLAYQLYQDAGHTLGWGTTTNTNLGTVPSLNIGSTVGGSASTTTTVYGRVFGSQPSVAPNSYTSVMGGGDTHLDYAGSATAPNTTCAGWTGTQVAYPSLNIFATVVAGCSVTANDLAFGSVGNLSSAVSASSQLNVTCTTSTAYQVSLDGGLSGGAPTARKMTSGANSVTYGIYQDAAHSNPWGASPNNASGTGTGANQVFTMYGYVPSQTTPPPGSYSDRVVATVTY
jgi:spore coat protein U-like protein